MQSHGGLYGVANFKAKFNFSSEFFNVTFQRNQNLTWTINDNYFNFKDSVDNINIL